jgi:hypothetical protein
MKDRDTLSSTETLIEENEAKTLKDEYSWMTKVFYAHYKTERQDEVIKACEDIHVEKQHQLRTSPQKYEFDGILKEFNMEQTANSLKLMDRNFKPIHARAYTVSRSVEQQLHPYKEIVRLVDIGVLEEEFYSAWASMVPQFAIPKKNGASTVRVVTDLGSSTYCLNLECYTFPTLKIGDMIRSE